MATFVHIFAEADRGSIRRSGIKAGRRPGKGPRGVYASPVTESYYYTHQWAREVQRGRNVPKLAARFRIPDKEPVLIGKYNGEHVRVPASEAVRIARRHVDPGGLEVIVPRGVSPKEILKIFKPVKVVGWRFYPKSKGKKPCGCPCCQRGEPYSRSIREAYQKDQEE